MENINIGETLKKLRKGKGFKTKYLIEGIMSESHYYKVEKGDTNITAILLIKLLDRMNVSPNDFIKMMNNSSFREKKKAFITKDLSLDGDFYYEHLIDLKKLKSNTLNTNEQEIIVKKIKNFLFEKEDFYHYEYSIFVNFLFILDLDTISRLENKAIKHGKKNAIDIESINNYFHLLCNLFYFYYTNKNYNKMKKIIEILNVEKKLYQNQLIGRHFIFIYYYNCLFLSFSNKKEAIENVEILLDEVIKFELYDIHKLISNDSQKI